MKYAWLVMIAVLAAAGCGTLSGGDCGCSGAGLGRGELVESKSAVNDVPMAAEAITVDGKLNDAAWAKATALSDFVRGPDRPKVKTRLLVTYDATNLYVAVVNEEPDTGDLVTSATKRDGEVWGGDCVEVYVDAWNSKDGDYYGFFVTPKNVVYDRSKDGSWSGEWTSATNVVAGKAWVAELAIPFKTLGIKAKKGHKIGVMVARNRKPGGGSYVTLVPCDNEAKNTAKYPTLKLN